MALPTILPTGLRVLAVCLLLAVCFAVGGVLSGLDKIAEQTVASQFVPPANQQVPQMPEDFLPSFSFLHSVPAAHSPTLSSGLAGMAGCSPALSS